MDKIEVIEQRTALLYGDEIIAVRAEDGHVYVSLRQMCESLELDRRGQVRRINNSKVLTQGYKGGDVSSPPSKSGRGGGKQTAGLLRVDLVPLWLTGIRTASVKEELREKLDLMQVNAARILWEAFQSGELTLDEDFQSLMNAASEDAVQAYLMVRAMLKLAKQQIVLEAKVADHDHRLEELEGAIASDDAVITSDEAMQISQAVKTVAIAEGKRSGRNEFGATYGELYRKFGVTSYKQVPRTKFKDVMKWLSEWFISVSDDNWPF